MGSYLFLKWKGSEVAQDRGPRVFAYVLDHPFTDTLLEMLAERAWPTIVVGGKVQRPPLPAEHQVPCAFRTNRSMRD